MTLPSTLTFTGVQINYYMICPTKLWYFSHFYQMEHGSDLVSLGKYLHESSYKKDKKDITIDSRISIDFVRRSGKLIIHDIKKSKKMEKAHYYQLLYYIYYLKHEKGLNGVYGKITYPKLKQVKDVELNEENKKELEDILKQTK